MSKNKKIRVPILLRIAALFMLGQLISIAAFLAISNKTLEDYVIEDKSYDASATKLALMTALGSKEGLFRIYEDIDFRNSVHKTSRYICKSMNARYLYLYTLDENNNRHYLICAASDDEDDKKMNENVGFGYVQEVEKLYSAEIAVLNEKKDIAYDIVDNDYGHVCSFILPVKADNSILALIGVDFGINNILQELRTQIRFVLLINFLIFVLELTIALLLVKHTVISPILLTSTRMKQFTTNRDVAIVSRKRIFDDEISDIEESFQKMETDISDYLQKIETLSLEKAQTAAQLDVARKIQSGIVPEEMNLTGNGYDVYGCMHPALEVGGDFYDIFLITEKKICVVIGDISGKGIAAALFMNMVKTALRARILAGMGLANALNDLNKELSHSNPENMFATVFTAILDCDTGELTYANAGHNPPILLKKNVEYFSPDSGIALGLFDDADIQEGRITLSENEGILIYTDGVTESVNAAKVQYGEVRLTKTLENRKETAKETVQKLMTSVELFVNGFSQFDDITCAALIYRGNKNIFSLIPDIASFATVKHSLLSSFGNTESSRIMIMVCEEIFTNIVNYSGADYISFSYENKDGICSITFSDNGIAFDPVNAVTKEHDFDDLDQGGMGIQLARMNTKEILYSRTSDKNVLTLRFLI